MRKRLWKRRSRVRASKQNNGLGMMCSVRCALETSNVRGTYEYSIKVKYSLNFRDIEVVVNLLFKVDNLIVQCTNLMPTCVLTT